MQLNRRENPFFLNDFVTHLTVIKMLSVNTVQGYYRDVRQFLRFYMFSLTNPDGTPDVDTLSEMPIQNLTAEDMRQVRLGDLYQYFTYLSTECDNHERILFRKASSLRSFFHYLATQANLIDHDPTLNLELNTKRRKKELPKYMNLDDSLLLLRTLTKQDNKKAHIRDYCILTLFLNCGIRLSELVGLNLSSIDFKESKMIVLGKGSKERTVYLNDACISALREYLFERQEIQADEKALFLSNQKKRISKRRVQQVVENALEAAGLDGRGLSTHKLRHTAATLMYQHGHVDLLTLKKILGHVSISTTEIYTHLEDTSVHDAMEHSPLAKEKRVKLPKK